MWKPWGCSPQQEELEGRQAGLCESSRLELSGGGEGVIGSLVCPGWWEGMKYSAPGRALLRQGSPGLYTPVPSRGPRPAVVWGAVHRPLLGSGVQPSHEPCRVVAITVLVLALPVQRSMAVCRMFSHCHSIVFTTVHENDGGWWMGELCM